MCIPLLEPLLSSLSLSHKTTNNYNKTFHIPMKTNNLTVILALVSILISLINENYLVTAVEYAKSKVSNILHPFFNNPSLFLLKP